ncbi:SDH family Clp fold serine proteinase [Pseudothermotoga thermarum]|uniref:Periplasmic serine protease n=1 Tax=Pseudothermotoga thermarum DSM 5069 TaxID=688269 RepID=F7YWT0_9THEM|nr:ATP-dependent Clp protease proteolytic subunit [Pseudothermotoga thermarum]AEH50315.1 periplasmic serine protease [Pseudothermotoga thermarum DSM 5069]
MGFIFELFWMILILSFFIPFLKAQMERSHRLALIRQLEIKRKSRVITLIHRQESMSFFGLTFGRYITIEDSEEILRAIKLTPPDMPIDLIIHTPGGLVLAAEQIARALCKHKGKVTVFVPHYAMSGGTLIALAADEIVMDPNAVLGPLDPQIAGYPAPSILSVLEKKNINEIDDQTLILADVAKKAMNQVREFVECLIKPKVGEEKAKQIAEMLTSGTWTHDYPITVDKLKEMGLNVSEEMPQEIYELMDLYKQTEQRRPSVQYIPAPYKGASETEQKWTL